MLALQLDVPIDVNLRKGIPAFTMEFQRGRTRRCLQQNSHSGSIRIVTFTIILASFVFALGDVETVLDHEITRAIETEFWFDEVIDANKIDVETRNGIVTLSGVVDNILTRQRTTKIAETVKGVRAIINDTEVFPLIAISDNDLRGDIEQALREDPVTDSYEVQVDVENGLVTLSGWVDSWQEKELCVTVAKRVRGVRGVNLEISVDYLGERSDQEIKQEIKRRLSYDVRVDDSLVELDVRDGKVELSGSVGSLAEKRLAAADAWVRGVKEVDLDRLEVQWWAREDMRRKTLYLTLSDEEIERAVEDAFHFDPRVKSYHVEVDARAGKVTLTGAVDNLEAKQAAAEDARNTVGVSSVTNHLKVRPLEVFSDEGLKRSVALALIKDPYVEISDIEIDTSNGSVYLSGKVNTSFEKNRAERVAEGVKGTVVVVNNIDYDYVWKWKPDREIRENVKEEIFWDSFVDFEQVEVLVEDGVVTLKGTVDTWTERRVAEANAWQGGAKDVRNQLTAKYQTQGPKPNFWRGVPY
jgi:osmotically-inducible protein OsmY